MPKGRAHDGGHTVFTDHSIPRRTVATRELRASGPDLVPYYTRLLPAAVRERNLGIAYASSGAADKAWPLLRSAAQSHPRDAQLYAHLGALLEPDKRVEQAIYFYRLALAIDPELDLAMNGLARTLLQHGEKEAACRLAQRSLRRNPRQPEMEACCDGLQ